MRLPSQCTHDMLAHRAGHVGALATRVLRRWSKALASPWRDLVVSVQALPSQATSCINPMLLLIPIGCGGKDSVCRGSRSSGDVDTS